jgi:beta-N-acetylhexosaminidase
MADQLSRDIHALFLPIVPKLEVSDFVTRFLGAGGISLLFGETRDEYVSHVIDPARVALETEAAWHKTIGRAREMAGHVLVAVDAEIGGIQRLHQLVPELPSLDHAQKASAADIAAASKRVAKAASALGANVFLSPVADVLVGKNPWLEGRTLGSDLGVVSKIVEAFVTGAQEGGVAATVKHFPGHPVCELDPAIHEGEVTWSLDQLRTLFGPFQAGIDAGADIVMMGPAIFSALNPPIAASLSGDLIGILRSELGFKGVVLTDDLDWKATIRDRSMEETAIAAVKAGADWMLVSANGVGKIDDMAAVIAGAVARGEISGAQIAGSAEKLRALAERLDLQRVANAG